MFIHSKEYMCEKLMVAMIILCGEGKFKDRLEDATISSFIRLDNFEYAPEDIKEDLSFVIKWTKDNLQNGKIIEEPNEEQRKELINRIINLFTKLLIK